MNTYVFHVDGIKEYSELKVLAPNKELAETMLKMYTVGGQPLVRGNEYKFVHLVKKESN